MIIELFRITKTTTTRHLHQGMVRSPLYIHVHISMRSQGNIIATILYSIRNKNNAITQCCSQRGYTKCILYGYKNELDNRLHICIQTSGRTSDGQSSQPRERTQSHHILSHLRRIYCSKMINLSNYLLIKKSIMRRKET